MIFVNRSVMSLSLSLSLRLTVCLCKPSRYQPLASYSAATSALYVCVCACVCVRAFDEVVRCFSHFDDHLVQLMRCVVIAAKVAAKLSAECIFQTFAIQPN